MSTFTFLHIGDVHLDTRFLCRTPRLRERLREALRTAFERAVDCAVREEVDALLIAGDLFDGDRLSYRTEAFLVDQLRRLDSHGITTIYVSGNHDPGGTRFDLFSVALPERFRFIRGNDVESVSVRGRGGEPVARVVGAGHTTARDSLNLARRFPPAEGPLPHVGLLHTMVTGARESEVHERYAPCAQEDLRRPGYSYWALGHIHVRQQVCDASHAYYCGNLQGRHPREDGPKGGLLVRLRSGLNPEVSFRSFAPLQWMQFTVDDLWHADSFQALTDAVRRAWDERVASSGDGVASDVQHLLRLTLSGPIPMYERLLDEGAIEDLEGALASALGVVDVEVRLERLSRPLELSIHRGQPHLLGETLELLRECAEDPELLLEIAPEVLAGCGARDGSARAYYLQALLAGLEIEAAMILLKEFGG